jgi:hypothetical protein
MSSVTVRPMQLCYVLALRAADESTDEQEVDRLIPGRNPWRTGHRTTFARRLSTC